MSFYRGEPEFNPFDGPAQPDEDRFRCPHCQAWMVDGDPSNVRLSPSEVICEDCAAQHPAIVGDVDAALKADERQDDFNERRR